jgi:hypothetical protein
MNRRFGGTYHLNLQDRKIRERRSRLQTAVTFSGWFLARGFFYPEDGGDIFLQNVGSHKIYSHHIPEDGILF